MSSEGGPSTGHEEGPPRGPPTDLPGGPPQSKREGSRWRRKRPAPGAARPLILFSLLTSVIFVAVLSAVFLPRILEPLEDLPQFRFNVSSGPDLTSLNVTDATGPRDFSNLRLRITETDGLGNSVEIANSTMVNTNIGPATVMDRDGNGRLDSGDSIKVSTTTGRSYELSISYELTGAVVALVRFP